MEPPNQEAIKWLEHKFAYGRPYDNSVECARPIFELLREGVDCVASTPEFCATCAPGAVYIRPEAIVSLPWTEKDESYYLRTGMIPYPPREWFDSRAPREESHEEPR